MREARSPSRKLSVAGRLRILLTLFALAAFVILVRGLFLSGWRFSGDAELKNALWLVGGAFLAFLGSIPMGGGRSRGYSR